jgi:ABC-type sugar transport system permease subunit
MQLICFLGLLAVIWMFSPSVAWTLLMLTVIISVIVIGVIVCVGTVLSMLGVETH